VITNSAAIRATTLIVEAQELLKEARSLLERVDEPPDEELGLRVLSEVMRRGASVSKQELYDIAQSFGMDRRGLGGFFRQSGKNSLYMLPGDRVLLTPYGVEQARRLMERNATYMYDEESTMVYAKVAESTFADDWNSEEDSVYDSL
jgi:hypothetical protein